MVGLIWVVQLVLYPAFRFVPWESFAAFEAAHTRRMGLLLAVPAPVEIVTGALLVWERPSTVPAALVLVAGAILAALWIVTALVQAPIHGKLSGGKDAALIERLISSNRVRTGLWTVRGGLVIVMLLA